MKIYRQINGRLNVVLAVTSIILLVGCSAAPPTHHLDIPPYGQSGNISTFDHGHSAFDRLLKKNVENGLVDYDAIQKQPDSLISYIVSLAAVDRKVIEKWSREQQLAFWINAYNAFTIQAIVERYPIRSRSFIGIFFPRNSILQISGVWSRITFNVGGRSLTLGDIEHEILRKKFIEPRIHFALVCASTSCPDLRSEAYRYDILEQQLHDQTIQFINDPTKGARYNAKKNHIYVSKIFEWFREDFSNVTAVGNSILAYIGQYYQDNDFIRAAAEEKDIRLSYLPYEWQLNEMVNPGRSVTIKREKDD